jgi:hypothetical protein
LGEDEFVREYLAIDTAAVAAVAVPATWFVTQFAGSIAKGLGDDAYRALKNNIARWSWTRRRLHRLSAPASPAQPSTALLELDEDLPREAFTELAALDWAAQPHGTYRFDAQSGHWIIVRHGEEQARRQASG